MEKITEKNLKQLIEKIRQGDSHALQKYIKQYERLVAGIVFRMIPHSADREDVCQDIFIKAYQNLAGFRFECKMSTWIAKIAYHTCLNMLSKKRERPVDVQKSLYAALPEEERPDFLTENQDLKWRLDREIAGMNVHYRTILTLYHMNKLNYQEIGSVMNLPEGTVKSYLHRARRELKTRLLLKYEREEL